MKASVKWLVEVKGYPSDRYVRDVPGGQMGEMKKTNPRLQAYHWFGDALLKVLRLKCKQPKLEVALGFPEKDVYLKLIREIDPVREGFRIRVYLVRHDGSVRRLDNSESGNKFDGTIEKFLEGKGNLV